MLYYYKFAILDFIHITSALKILKA